jgi:hypothetical protein
LEVVFCDEAGLHQLSKESLEKLAAAASGWDQQFRETILAYSHELSFEPLPEPE